MKGLFKSCFFRFAFVYITLFSFFVSCSKEQSQDSDCVIELIDEGHFVVHDTIAEVGDTIYIKIHAVSNTDIPLVQIHFEKISPDDTIGIDTSIYCKSIIFEKKIIKSAAEYEIWNITASDRNRNKSNTVSFRLNKKEGGQYHEITHLSAIKLGLQGNQNFGGFYSLSNMQSYTLNEAFPIQEEIHMAAFYDSTGDEHVIASPGANIPDGIYTGSEGIENWSTVNTTRYILSDITLGDFDNCQNDSLLYANTFTFELGKRKAKNLQVNDIYCFISDKGNFGLFKVISIDGLANGSVEIEIKMK